MDPINAVTFSPLLSPNSHYSKCENSLSGNKLKGFYLLKDVYCRYYLGYVSKKETHQVFFLLSPPDPQSIS